MSDIPSSIKNSILWRKINSDPQLLQAVKDIRETVEKISSKISQFLPDFTDHSVDHMDKLWTITDIVFKEEEMQKFTLGEAFILACSFYVHDLGMAYCVTEEGRKQIEQIPEYQAIYNRLVNSNISEDEAKFKGLQIEARKIHAEKALELVQDKLPGLDRYLIESTELRQKWSEHIGQVSSSHHWSIKELDKKIGCRGKIPDPLETSDLGFVSCALRIIDYAHINHERASTLDRLLRNDIGKESLVHWLALENITGPSREDDKLVYGSSKRIESVDGWWKYYELALGLNREIIAVQEYLDSRSYSKGRFSLRGIKGIEFPEDFAIYVQPKDFEPIDIRFRADSIERLIGLLGGKQLYGEDYSTPLRELIQNAVDAINLYRTQHDKDDYGEISVVIENGSHENYLTVEDNGIGMGKNTVTKYLLSIASDYWNSEDFTQDYPEAYIKNFKPVGKYGIGFLSVFMISDNVEIETERIGSPRLNLYIKGLGQRGYLKTNTSTGICGTKVKMRISNKIAKDYKGLPAIIKAKAPMVNIPIKVQYGKNKEENILPEWWQNISQERLTRFLMQHDISVPKNKKRRQLTRRGLFVDTNSKEYLDYYRDRLVLSKISNVKKWPGKQPEIVSDTFRIIALPNASHILICSKGLAIRSMAIKGMVGLVDIGEVELDTSRSYTLEWDYEIFRKETLEKLSPKIINALNNMTKETNIPERFEFIAEVGQAYGYEVLTKTKLDWINIIKPPGDIILISADGLAKNISEAKEIYLVYGASPWRSYSICRERFGDIGGNAILVTVSSAGQPEPGSYRDEDEIIECPLPEHFLGEYTGGFENAVMIKAILEIISKCWNITLENLFKSEWNRKNQTLCGFIKRT